MSGGRVAAGLRLLAVDPAGVKEHGIDTAGSLGTWEAPDVSLSINVGVGGAKPETSWPPAGVGPRGKDEDRRTGGYRQTKATKCGGTGGRKS